MQSALLLSFLLRVCPPFSSKRVSVVQVCAPLNSWLHPRKREKSAKKKKKNKATQSGKRSCMKTKPGRQNQTRTWPRGEHPVCLSHSKAGFIGAKDRLLIRVCHFQSFLCQRAHWLTEGGEKGGETKRARREGAEGASEKPVWPMKAFCGPDLSYGTQNMIQKCPSKLFFFFLNAPFRSRSGGQDPRL